MLASCLSRVCSPLVSWLVGPPHFSWSCLALVLSSFRLLRVFLIVGILHFQGFHWWSSVSGFSLLVLWFEVFVACPALRGFRPVFEGFSLVAPRLKGFHLSCRLCFKGFSFVLRLKGFH